MKITTVVTEGQDRAVVLLDNPSAEGFSPPETNRHYLDITAAVQAMAGGKTHNRRFDILLGDDLPFLTVRKLISGGEESLEILKELLDEKKNLYDRGDGDIAASALVPEELAHLRTPVPDTPLYLVCHSNNPMPWRKQIKGDAARHISQVPSVRIRTVNSLLGQDESLYLPPGYKLTMGTEFGFVIGAEANSVKAEDALKHVAGYVCTNDCYSGIFSATIDFENGQYALTSNVQTADKCTDGCGPVGPWIATADEVGNPHDLIAITWQDGVLRDRAHTGSYIRGVEETVERLSHLMTLPPGTIISLGAAGWDGFYDEPKDRESGHSLLEAEIEKVGVLRTHIRYPQGKTRSPFFTAGTIGDSSPLDRLVTDSSVFSGQPGAAPSHQRKPSSFWMLIANQKDSIEYEPENIHSASYPVPMPLPASSLAIAEQNDEVKKINLPATAGRAKAACQLAVVAGPEAAYQRTRQGASEHIAGYAVMLSVHDFGPFDAMELPTTVFERRWALFLGYLGDARHVLGTTQTNFPQDSLDLHFKVGNSEWVCPSSWYENSASDAIAYLSKSVTVLPGDVIGLGPLGEWVDLPGDELIEGISLRVECKGLPTAEAVVSRSPA